MHEIDDFVFHLMNLKGKLLETLFSMQLMAIKKLRNLRIYLLYIYLLRESISFCIIKFV